MRRAKWVLIVPLALLVLAVGGTWVYINVLRDDAPERLTLESNSSDTAVATAEDASASAPSGIDGTWTPTPDSQAGYRVNEVLFGQRAEAVGRTNDVTGSLVISRTTVSEATFTVDMTTVASDENRRDNQFKGRIMDVSTYPTSTFTLTSPIELGSLPAAGESVTVNGTGKLTLRGTTKTVTLPLTAQLDGDTIKVQGSVPITFDEWGIPNPSFGPAETEDHGELEFLLVFTKG
jgi:polyisoprenoid-binding protein YceI